MLPEPAAAGLGPDAEPESVRAATMALVRSVRGVAVDEHLMFDAPLPTALIRR